MIKIKIISTLIFILFSSANFAGENSVYNFNWLDDDETVFVIQNKEYPTSKRFEFNFSYGDSDNSTYQASSAATGGLTYYFSDTFSVDISYKKYLNANSADLDSLINVSQIKPLLRIIDTSAFIHFNWLPFYGKINTLNKIFYFYWGVGLGVGQFETRTNYKTFQDTDSPLTYISENVLGLNTKTFVKFFLSESWNFGFEFDLYTYNAINQSDETQAITMYKDLSLIFGYIF